MIEGFSNSTEQIDFTKKASIETILFHILHEELWSRNVLHEFYVVIEPTRQKIEVQHRQPRVR